MKPDVAMSASMLPAMRGRPSPDAAEARRQDGGEDFLRALLGEAGMMEEGSAQAALPEVVNGQPGKAAGNVLPEEAGSGEDASLLLPVQARRLREAMQPGADAPVMGGATAVETQDPAAEDGASAPDDAMVETEVQYIAGEAPAMPEEGVAVIMAGPRQWRQQPRWQQADAKPSGLAWAGAAATRPQEMARAQGMPQASEAGESIGTTARLFFTGSGLAREGATVRDEGQSHGMMRAEVWDASSTAKVEIVSRRPMPVQEAALREGPVQVVQMGRQQFLPPAAMPVAAATGGEQAWSSASQQVLQALQGEGLAALMPGASGPRATAKVVQQLQIQLHPANLGTVNAQLSLSGGRLQIDIRVPDQRMVEHLRRGVEQLEQRIKAQDAGVAQTTVRIVVDPSAAPPAQPSAMPGHGQGHAAGAGAGAGQGMQEFARQDGGGDARSPRRDGGHMEDATGGRGQDETPDTSAGAGAVYL